MPFRLRPRQQENTEDQRAQLTPIPRCELGTLLGGARHGGGKAQTWMAENLGDARRTGVASDGGSPCLADPDGSFRRVSPIAPRPREGPLTLMSEVKGRDSNQRSD